MAINVSQPFHRTSGNAIDETITLTKAQMLAVNDNLMPSKYFTICQDDGAIYLYDKSATSSVETGKFTKFEGGSGESIQVSEMPTATAELEDRIVQYVGNHPTDINYAANATSNFTAYNSSGNPYYYSIANNNIQLKTVQNESVTIIKCTQPLTNKGTLKITRAYSGDNSQVFTTKTLLGTTVGGNDIYQSSDWGRTSATDTIDLSQYNNSTIYVSFKMDITGINSGAVNVHTISSVRYQVDDEYTNGYFYKCVAGTSVNRSLAIPQNYGTSDWAMLPTITMAQTVTANNVKNGFYKLNGTQSEQIHTDNVSVTVNVGDTLGFQAVYADAVAYYKELPYLWERIDVQPSSGGGGGEATIIDGLLEASGWHPTLKTQSIILVGYESSMGGVIGVPSVATKTQKEAYATSKINLVSISGTTFTFECEEIPSVDLPVTLYAGGGSGGGGADLPSGGTTGQALVKHSNADQDVEWATIEGEKVQYDTMPTASADNLGQIVQYIGTTDANYTNGLFYECVSDGESTPTYSWAVKDVQTYPEVDLTNVFASGMPIASVQGVFNYSTDEKVVGTWIDGKPLYQKTLVDTSPSAINTAKTISMGVSADTILITSCFMKENNNTFYPIYITDDGNTGFIKVLAYNNSHGSTPNVIRLFVKGISSWCNLPVYITVQYTKTTD